VTTQRVYLLGAGFSMAVSSDVPDEYKMPSMWQLSDAVVDLLRGIACIPRSPPVGGAPGIWHAAHEQFRARANRATFLDVSAAISNVLGSRQAMTVFHQKGKCPDWLARLVRRWHLDAANVITFNYDQFVELAWLAHAEPTPPRVRSWDLYAAPLMPLTSRAGVTPPVYSVPGGFRLMKLHGSLGWWYSGPDSPPSDTVYDQGVKGPGWTHHGLFAIGEPYGSLPREKSR
jgi:hypothetical protein